MKCKRCGRELKKEWNYCPYCGEKKTLFKFSFNLFGKDVEEEIKEIFDELFPNIRITFKTREPQKQIQIKKHVPIREVEKVVEPKTNIKRFLGKLEISIELPDVSSVNDIIIRKFSESIEIRAYAGKKMYFKVIPLEEEYNLFKKIFKNGILKLVLSR